MAQNKRRGRPRLMKAKVDRGTPEVIHKRKQLLQNLESANPALAESLLGLFYARGLLSKPLYEAGLFFGELGYKYETCLDIPIQSRESALKFNRRGLTHYPDSYYKKHTKAWNNAVFALKDAGQEAYLTVMGVVFYKKNVYQNGLPHSILKASPYLKRGLETLDAYFRKGSKSMTRYTDS